jgi:hypothetical protein
MTRMLSVLAGASLLALAGAANAGEPVALNDSQLDGVSAGGSFSIYQSIVSTGLIGYSVYGNTAVATANATATGYATYTDSEVSTNATAPSFFYPGTSSSSATAVSIAN